MELMLEPTGETDKEKTDGSVFFFFCYIVVIVKSYKLKLATVDLQSLVFSDISYHVPALHPHGFLHHILLYDTFLDISLLF